MTRRNGAQSIAGALAAVAVLALASGCGGGDDKGGGNAADAFATQAADDIVAAAKADMGNLKSVHYAGELSSSDGQPISLDMKVTSDGSCTGSFGVAGGSAEVIGVGGSTWFKPDEAFWREQSPDQADVIISTVGDKYVVDSNGDFTEFCDLNALLGQLLDKPGTDSTYTVSGTEQLDGATVVAVDRANETDGPSTGYVLSDSPHYLVKIVKEGTESGTVTFTEFNAEVTVEAPAADQVIDLSAAG
ncbi:MAG: lipoprotein [Nocardioides sp.]|nr:lipoprotein [Nocardioides sp.]